jgi:7-cyano-7-deazaguanine synthase in queuosine biosynthesis
VSNQSQREKHGERFFQKIKKLARKLKLAKEYGYDHVLKNPHKYHKQSPFNCGNPDCVMCMNPRKAFKEKTMQERKFEQQEKIKDD